MKYLIYAGVMLVAAAGLVLGLERMTRPPTMAELASTETNSGKTSETASAEPSLHTATVPATGAVRKIPIVGTNPDDPNNDLTPIYPASPGADLPPKKVATQDAPDKNVSTGNVVAANQAAENTVASPAETNGNAPSRDAAPAGRTAEVRPQSPAACNIQVCTGAYRFFRASDCSYQPYEGPRQLCTVDDTGNPAPRQQAQSGAPSPPARAGVDDAELRAVEREVRALPGPDSIGGDHRGVVIYRDDGSRYSLRRNWIYDR